MAFLPRVRRLFAARPPAASLEIAADRVTGVALERGGQAGRPVVVTEPLPDGALVPAANASNLIDRAAVSEAVARDTKPFLRRWMVWLGAFSSFIRSREVDSSTVQPFDVP